MDPLWPIGQDGTGNSVDETFQWSIAHKGYLGTVHPHHGLGRASQRMVEQEKKREITHGTRNGLSCTEVSWAANVHAVIWVTTPADQLH